MASIQKEGLAADTLTCFFALSTCQVARFACGAWPSTGEGVVQARIHSQKIRTTKVSSEGSGAFTRNFIPSKFPAMRYICVYNILVPIDMTIVPAIVICDC